MAANLCNCMHESHDKRKTDNIDSPIKSTRSGCNSAGCESSNGRSKDGSDSKRELHFSKLNVWWLESVYKSKRKKDQFEVGWRNCRRVVVVLEAVVVTSPPFLRWIFVRMSGQTEDRRRWEPLNWTLNSIRVWAAGEISLKIRALTNNRFFCIHLQSSKSLHLLSTPSPSPSNLPSYNQAIQYNNSILYITSANTKHAQASWLLQK